MYRFLLVFSSFCLLFLQLPAEAQQHTASESDVQHPHETRPIPYPIDVPWEFKEALKNGTRKADGSPGEAYWQQFADYTIDVSIDPETHILSGRMRAVYYNNSPDVLNNLHLELAQNVHSEGTIRARPQEVTGGITLNRVSVNGIEFTETMSERNSYYVDNTQLVLRPERGIRPGGEAEVSITWEFTVPDRGAGGRMGRDEDLYFIGYWYPHFSVYDDVYGWMTDPFRGNAEFYHGFADYDISITMPADWVVMSTGAFLNPAETLAPHVYARYQRAQESNEVVHVIRENDFRYAATKAGEGESQTWKFRAENVRDVAFSATRRSYWDAARTPVGDLNGDGNTNYTLINSFYREEAPLWRESAVYAMHSVTFLSELADMPYPWPHMTAVEGANIIGGGMEFPMMTVIGDYNHLGAWRLYSVTAHEIAHMWMPMIVSTNERRYTWIDEGNTVFKTDHARKDFFPQMEKHTNTQRSYINFAMTGWEGEMMRWSDFHYTQQAYGVASYPKPASVLVALRGVLGEEVFWDAYHTFMREWAYKHPYPWDMFSTYERVSGKDLGWFWRAWYYETWTLDQKVYDVRESSGETIIKIKDLGDVPMPVLLRVTLENDEIIDKRISQDVWLQGKREIEVNMPVTGVVNVEIDPDQHFPDVDRFNNEWQRRD